MKVGGLLGSFRRTRIDFAVRDRPHLFLIQTEPLPENHIHALAVYFMHYNFVRQHKAHRMSPAMAAGLTDRLWSMEDIAERIDTRVNQPKARGHYKKRRT